MNNKDEIDEILLNIKYSTIDGLVNLDEYDTREAKQQLLALKKTWEQEQTFKVIQSLVKSGGISDHLASTTLNIFTTNGDK